MIFFFKRRVLDEDHTHHHRFPVFKKDATESWIQATSKLSVSQFVIDSRLCQTLWKFAREVTCHQLKRPLNSNETWRESQLKNFLPSAIFSMCSEHETCLSFSFLSFSISFDEIFILLHIPIIPIINEKSCNSYHHKNCNPKLVHLDFLWVFKFISLIQTLRHLMVRTRYLYH